MAMSHDWLACIYEGCVQAKYKNICCQIRRKLCTALAERRSPPCFGFDFQGGHLVRIKGHFCQTATATGQLAMKDPNLQNVPKPRYFNVKATQTQISAGGTTSKRREHEANIRCFCKYKPALTLQLHAAPLLLLQGLQVLRDLPVLH